jgi:hypothetical protein
MTIPKQIITTGKVFYKYLDDASCAKIGDIMLLLNDDALSSNVGDYENTSSSGYIKAKIFDGLVWQNIDICEFCTNKENKFTKRHKPIDSMDLCRDIISKCHKINLYRTYRGHFTTEQYQQQPYDRRSSRGRKIKPPK